MNAIITAKSELRLSDLTREYTFDIITTNGDVVLASQVVTARPDEIVNRLNAIVSEYETAYFSQFDVEVGEVV
jgi:hypothetical protein